GHFFMGIGTPDHYFLDPVTDDQFGTGRCFSLVYARLQIDVKGRFLQHVLSIGIAFKHLVDGIYLRVGPSVMPVPALSDDPAPVNDHGADQRIRTDLSHSVCSQLQATAHVANVFFHLAKIVIFAHITEVDRPCKSYRSETRT